MYEAMHVIDPVVKMVVGVGGGVVRLSWASRKSVGSVVFAFDMDEFKLERKDGEDPSIDRSGGGDVGIREHTFDVTSVDFNDKILNAEEIESSCTKRAVESVNFEFGLRKSSFAVVKCYRTEAIISSDFRIIFVALAKEVANSD